MYCIKCGVKLADSELECPLCTTRVYHPDLDIPNADPPYPMRTLRETRVKPFVPAVVVLVLFILPMLISVIADLEMNYTFTWSLYVIGALVVGYLAIGLPMWFESPNPVIFAPPVFAAIIAYLFEIDILTSGGWFLSFAFPVAGGLSLIAIAVITLIRYLPHAWLYVVGGAIMALGAFMPLVEHLLILNFNARGVAWSLYPLVVFLLLGGLCIFIRACRPMREAAERKFFF